MVIQACLFTSDRHHIVFDTSSFWSDFLANRSMFELEMGWGKQVGADIFCMADVNEGSSRVHIGACTL